MLAAAAVCPHPPLLVPELAGAASAELDGLRAACDLVVGSLIESRPDVLVVVGGAGSTASHPPDSAGSFAPYGVDVRVGEGEPTLPLSLTAGRWLLDRAGYPGRLALEAVAFDAPAEDCLRLGRDLAASAGRVALLVMGDGSACLTEKSPGYLDPAARPYQEMLVRALERADADALAGLDPGEADRLLVAGRAAWQVLAGAAGGRGCRGGLHYAAAPYGVGYVVAEWVPEPAGR
ncbi:class III extradiol dioxygenase subunit B-like domain-containing protein [Rhizohabitans arisaemae]|uniref:class III extradiol dioxygenase subunit B-like domain-containing protein n=1 Tax=Rhizohabitans arisaemae TaxID=2720610 RepID=UPI0024B24846|nr:class III extradiol dioxygenase subunit B-like domain-containing protein [Rhizohabitans arisaemae]